MGLDMYLHRKSYYGGKWKEKGEHNSPHDMKISGEFVKKNKIDISRISYVEEEAGYWRKANAIHAWFVSNVQDGEDNCKEYYVDREYLENLLKLCKKVLKASKLIDGDIINGYSFVDGKEVPNIEKGKIIENPAIANELLPTQLGCFFGGTDYDEWYLADIKHTIEIIEKILSNKDDTAEYSYQSSW